MGIKVAGIFFAVLGIVLAIVSYVYGIIFAWQCFTQLFAVGGSFEVAKHALIVFIACRISDKVALGIAKGLLEYKYD